MRKTMKAILTILTMTAVVAFFAAPAAAGDPMEKADEEWITVNGTVTDAAIEGFKLDYGEGFIWVEMDDWDWYDESYAILEGDNVQVTGKIDHDLFERRTIEASSVYVENLNTWFYASAADEERARATAYVYTAPLVTSHVTMTGTIKSVDGREFILDTGLSEIQVDTDELAYDPMDDEGFQKLDVGDRVMVHGPLDVDLFERTEITARSITSISS